MSPSLYEKLEVRWRKLWKMTGVKMPTSWIISPLAYREECGWRNHKDIMDAFVRLEEFHGPIRNPVALEFAIFYYDVARGDQCDSLHLRRERGVSLFMLDTRSFLRKDLRQEIADLIRATKPGAVPNDSDAQALREILGLC